MSERRDKGCIRHPPGFRPVTRRDALALCAAASLISATALARTPADAGNADAAGPPTLLVGGPPGGTASEFAALLAPLLGPALLGPSAARPGSGRLSLDSTGGLDGVTAANEFEARASPDGSTALMVPGTAALAWLAGDPRVHFDAGLWVPALAAVAPAVLVGRAQLDNLPEGTEIRLAASGPAGRELAAILGLELIRFRSRPVFNLRVEADMEAALRDGRVDAILLTGRGVPARFARLRAAGFVPLFALGERDGTRDPSLPHIETLDELAGRRYGHHLLGPLAPAYRAAAAAAQLDAALVLPQLATAGTVARWRAACDEASASPIVQSATSDQALRSLTAPDCVGAVSAVLAGETALLDLHRFLADRYDWQPA